MTKKILFNLSFHIISLIIILIAIYSKSFFNDGEFMRGNNIKILIFMNSFILLIVGMLINSIGKSIQEFKIKPSYILLFFILVVLFILLWLIYPYLPAIIANNINIISFLLAIFAGAFLFSGIFHY